MMRTRPHPSRHVSHRARHRAAGRIILGRSRGVSPESKITGVPGSVRELFVVSVAMSPANDPIGLAPMVKTIHSLDAAGRKRDPIRLARMVKEPHKRVLHPGKPDGGHSPPQVCFSFTVTFTIGASPMGSFVELPLVDFEKLTKQQPDGGVCATSRCDGRARLR